MRARLPTVFLLLCCVGPAAATDQPISGAKLTLRRSSSGKEKLVFVSKDPSFLFPAIGSADDPATGTPGGAIVEVSSLSDPDAVGAGAAPGVGNPGWKVKDGTNPSYAYRNGAAEEGNDPVRAVTLKRGKRIKITARDTLLPLVSAQGGVGIRITTGSLRSCAFFGPETVRHDEANRFDAVDAPAPAVADCTDALPHTSTSFGTSTTTSSTTSTTLVLEPCTGGSIGSMCSDGVCQGSDTCQVTVTFVGSVGNPIGCLCYPPGVTSCAATPYPTCGGSCPTGGVCQALHDFTTGAQVCGCVDPAHQCGSSQQCDVGVCAPGLVCSAPPVGCDYSCTGL
jgi:hypothetical protein